MAPQQLGIAKRIPSGFFSGADGCGVHRSRSLLARHSRRTPTLRAVLQCIGVRECGRAYSCAAHSVCHPVPPLGGCSGPLLLSGRCSSPKGCRLLSPRCVYRWLSLVCWVKQGINAVAWVCRISRPKRFFLCACSTLFASTPRCCKIACTGKQGPITSDHSKTTVQCAGNFCGRHYLALSCFRCCRPALREEDFFQSSGLLSSSLCFLLNLWLMLNW